MITDGEKWHYLAVKNLPGLLKGTTSTHEKDFYCLNCFHSYRTKSKLESHKKICENHDFCHLEMPTKDNNIIKYNHGEKSMKVPFIIYADLECLLEKMSTCINNPCINTHHQDIRYLLVVHLMNREINQIIIEVKIV